MNKRTINTRFSVAPLAMIDPQTGRVLVYSEELHETFVFSGGRWLVGRFTDSDLKANFRKVDTKDAWRYLKQAMAQVGFI